MMKEKRRKKGQSGQAVRRGAAVFLCVLTAVVFAGCGAAGSGVYDTKQSESISSGPSYAVNGGSYPEESEGVLGDMAAPGSGAGSGGAAGAESAGITEGRKLIRSVSLEVETREYEQMISSLETRVLELGGYIENMDAYNGSSYSDSRSLRYANLSIRIPSEKLNGFLQTVSDISNIVRRYDSVEDVTLSYVDMESRRDTLRTEQSRLLEFLERAETVEEIIALEERLSEVRYQLESMESQLRTVDNLIDYSTVDIHISEVRELTEVAETEPTVTERIRDGFLESLEEIGDGATEVCIWFAVNTPYLAIWAVILALLVVIWRSRRRKAVQRQEQKRREAEARMQNQQAALQRWEAGQQTVRPVQESGRQTAQQSQGFGQQAVQPVQESGQQTAQQSQGFGQQTVRPVQESERQTAQQSQGFGQQTVQPVQESGRQTDQRSQE